MKCQEQPPGLVLNLEGKLPLATFPSHDGNANVLVILQQLSWAVR